MRVLWFALRTFVKNVFFYILFIAMQTNVRNFKSCVTNRVLNFKCILNSKITSKLSNRRFIPQPTNLFHKSPAKTNLTTGLAFPRSNLVMLVSNLSQHVSTHNESVWKKESYLFIYFNYTIVLTQSATNFCFSFIDWRDPAVECVQEILPIAGGAPEVEGGLSN